MKEDIQAKAKKLLKEAERLEALQGGEFSIAAVTASFNPAAGILTSFGDALNNTITVSRNAAGRILINEGAVAVVGGTPTVANTALIQVFGQGGNDTITLNQANGALPRANLFGGAGNDTITGGAGGDMLFGQSGNDILIGGGGFDFLFGGSEDDVLTGGDADDQVFGESGNDRFIWNPGDDTDLFEGGAGTDTTEVNGGGGAEVFTLTANGARTRFDRIDPAPFSLDMGTMEKIVVNMNGGNDSFSATGNLAALIGVTVDGGAGNDTILGSNGQDLLIGGADNDFIDGQQGNDTAQLGAGNDVFQWDPGDGSDVVEGGGGTDEMLFNGSGGNEEFTASANGGRVLFTRNLGNIVMDLNEVETLTVNALGGTDKVTVNDLSGTDVTKVAVNLAGTIGGTAGDNAADQVIVNATSGNNIIDVFGAGTSLSVLGLSARVDIANSEGANDTLVIQGLDGDDGITATTLPAGVAKLVLDGGKGDDTILGSQGADTLRGGDDDDFVFGDNGNDLAELGAGDDVFQWDPGDGNDTIEGAAGSDQLLFFGSGASENINIVANGGRALFLRDVANVTMDMDDLETIEYRALGGSDNIVIGDLSGTDVQHIDIVLRGPIGGGDGAADAVTANGTQGADVFGVAGDAGGIHVFGLSADVDIFFQEQGSDRLTLNGQGGDDVIDATSLEADGIQLTINGGLGDDILLGSEGNDLFNGGDGNDVAFMGAGDDTFVWNPGDDNDTLEGQAGFDTMLFNGSNAAEQINITAAAEGHVLFTRDVATVVMDLDDVESIDFNALGGADTITIGDLSGTDVTEININLTEAANLQGADTIIINATNGDDVALVVGDSGSVSVLGLSAQVNITGFDAANDRLIIRTLDGDDVIEASGVAGGSIQLQLEGGNDDDILIGGEGNDILLGGEGDDVLIGGGGTDILDGGPGDNVGIQSVAVSPDPMIPVELMVA
jgi:Ca2+-binding RTX toxin-like protein